MKLIRGRRAGRNRATRTAATRNRAETAKASATHTAGASSAPRKPATSLKLDFPLVTMNVRAPDLRMPQAGLDQAVHVVQTHVMQTARALLPPAERVGYYAGLGAITAVGLMEWPVAAAIGAGTVIARRAVRSGPLGLGADCGGTGGHANGHIDG
jgi:hypothetical protein